MCVSNAQLLFCSVSHTGNDKQIAFHFEAYSHISLWGVQEKNPTSCRESCLKLLCTRWQCTSSENKQQKPPMSWTTVKPYQRLLSILTFLVTLTFHDCQDYYIHQINQKSSSVFHWINMKFLTGIELFKFSYLQVSTKRKALCT